MSKLKQFENYLEKHPALIMPLIIALCVPLLTIIYLISLSFPKSMPMPTYNKYFEDGIPIVNCKNCQNIPDLDDPYQQSRLIGHISYGYCPESNYDIAISNSIAELYRKIAYLEKEIERLKENK